jgi:hypothetical protein
MNARSLGGALHRPLIIVTVNKFIGHRQNFEVLISCTVTTIGSSGQKQRA